eukprot:6444781-Prymnesium_polylepis.1
MEQVDAVRQWYSNSHCQHCRHYARRVTSPLTAARENPARGADGGPRAPGDLRVAEGCGASGGRVRRPRGAGVAGGEGGVMSKS